MNKAFCKESDESIPSRCPRCDNEGVRVGAETLAAHAEPAHVALLGDPAFCCGTDTCDVAYFDLLGRTIGVADASGLCWPKDPTGPLCSCHGLTIDEVDADIVAGTPRRVREVVQAAGRADAACFVRSPDGRPCAARVQRVYMRRRAELGGG